MLDESGRAKEGKHAGNQYEPIISENGHQKVPRTGILQESLQGCHTTLQPRPELASSLLVSALCLSAVGRHSKTDKMSFLCMIQQGSDPVRVP